MLNSVALPRHMTSSRIHHNTLRPHETVSIVMNSGSNAYFTRNSKCVNLRRKSGSMCKVCNIKWGFHLHHKHLFMDIANI
jgi:hypothetical protein